MTPVGSFGRGQPDRHAAGVVEVLLRRGQGVLGLSPASRHRSTPSQPARRASSEGAGRERPGASRHAHSLSRPADRSRRSRRRPGPAHGDDGCDPGTPEPSRRPFASGRSTAAPLARPPRAGPGPAQANTSVSSPLRKRWQRTPPVPRPLAGYSANGVTLTAPGSVPGSAVRGAARRSPRPRESSGSKRAEGDDRLLRPPA